MFCYFFYSYFSILQTHASQPENTSELVKLKANGEETLTKPRGLHEIRFPHRII